jgi:hypothetical protein
LFSTANSSGSFDTISALPPGPDMQWAFDSGSGVLRVVSALAQSPTNISYSVSGGTLNLAWPATYVGWVVQSNSVSVAAPDAWYDVPGSGAVTTLSVPLNPANAQVFYRLRRPW